MPTCRELIVKVVDAADPLKIQLLAGHKRPVRAASWSPDGNHIVSNPSPASSHQTAPLEQCGGTIQLRKADAILLVSQATSSSDGQIMIWALNAGSEATCIHTIDGLIKADQPSYALLALSASTPFGLSEFADIVRDCAQVYVDG